MSELSIEISWQRSEPELRPGSFSNKHALRYNDRVEVPVDAAPDWGGDATNTNPEQALAAALSSCYMMTFLSLSAKAGWPVVSFEDRAVAHLGKNPKGRMSVARIDLHPVVSLEDAKLEAMRHRAHRYCFISNTLAESVEFNIL